MDLNEVIDLITNAFGKRQLPANLLRLPIGGEELPFGHPGFGLGDPIPDSEADSIARSLLGRKWCDVDPKDLEWSVFYLTSEAFVYYLPSILIFNIKHDHQIDTIDNALQGYLKGGAEWRLEIAAQTTHEERCAIVSYMNFFDNVYAPGDVDFWATFS